eukprot:3882359-Rhodomonas_salina.4
MPCPVLRGVMPRSIATPFLVRAALKEWSESGGIMLMGYDQVGWAMSRTTDRQQAGRQADRHRDTATGTGRRADESHTPDTRHQTPDPDPRPQTLDPNPEPAYPKNLDPSHLCSTLTAAADIGVDRVCSSATCRRARGCSTRTKRPSRSAARLA